MGLRVPYHDGEQRLEGYLAALPHAHDLPGVFLVPSWLNVVQSTCRRADRLGEMGYAVFVADLFGAGVHPRPPQLPQEVVAPFLRDRLLFRKRLLAGFNAFRNRPECNPDRVAAIGYCLGGCGVLELARAGVPLRGVVSLHGMLSAPIPARPKTIMAKILVLHGDDDPLSPFEQVAAFRDEMRSAQANWEFDIYGGARHSFTGEGILNQQGPEARVNPQFDSRSWRATVEFLSEVLK